jgi:hypothetical protein
MIKMGYQPGGGIGKNKRGITRPIEVIKMDKKAGLGQRKKIGFNYSTKSNDNTCNKEREKITTPVYDNTRFVKLQNYKSHVILSEFHPNLIRLTEVEKTKIAKIDKLIKIKDSNLIETNKKKQVVENMKLNRYINLTKAVESTIEFICQSVIDLKLEDLGVVQIEFRRLFIKEYFFKESYSLLASSSRSKIR